MAIRGTANLGASSHYGLDHREGRSQADRCEVGYTCPSGHSFTITLAADASAPDQWDCRCGRTGHQAGTPASATDEDLPARHRDSTRARTARTAALPGPPRTPWIMLTERRSRQELQALLDERLDLLRSGRLRPDGTRR
jgi:hypothetical protein